MFPSSQALPTHLRWALSFLFWLTLTQPALKAQNDSGIDPANITIARDSWGVPHIYAPTDAEVAYGLAWATAEDDFESVQFTLLAVRGRLGEVEGKEGAVADVVTFLIDANKLVEERYDSELSEDYKALIEAYAQAINDYADQHPEEVLLKNTFPVTPKDLVKGYTLALVGMTGVDMELLKVFDGTIAQYEDQIAPKGSNAMAYSRRIMADGQTTLISNSHQPVLGPFAWYEAHLVSDEGWNMLGATFPGAPTMFVGTTPNLGWTHTLNYPDFTDIYKLVMHPKDKLRYRYDGKWLDLEKRKFKFKVKVAGVKLPISKTFYRSVHGPVVKNKEGFYALRFPAMMGVRAGEQWYKMNKAQNFEQWEAAVRTQGIPGINVVYADASDEIFYLSNGHFGHRVKGYNWKDVLPGDTSLVVWEPEWDPIDSLPLFRNPDCGYLFNTNNSPFFATCEAENLDPADFDPNKGYQLYNNNRAWRFHNLTTAALEDGQLTIEEVKEIKYDTRWERPARTYVVSNLEDFFELDPDDHPRIADAINVLKAWDRNSDVENRGAAFFNMLIIHAIEYLVEEGRLYFPNEFTEEEMTEIIRDTKQYMNRHYGTLTPALGEVQFHVRGKVSGPVGGSPDVLAAMYTEKWKGHQGKRRSSVADCYIMFARYESDGLVSVETVNSFGASAHPESPHYTDQLELYLNHQLKTMTLDWEEIVRTAERVYHPGE